MPDVETLIATGVVIALIAAVLGYMAGWRGRDEYLEDNAHVDTAHQDAMHDEPMRLNDYAFICHSASAQAGWWTNLQTGESLLPTRNHGELFMLMVSELAEAMEGKRKNLMDDKLPHRKMVEVELADCLIRIFDYAGAYKLDLDGAVREKLAFNATRADHKPENRRLADGKKF